MILKQHPLLSRKTKIVSTLGPATSTRELIGKLIDAGANVFRLNFSHGNHADHAERHRIIRDLEAEKGIPIGILADVQGPKLRVGRFEKGKVQLQKGDHFRLDLNDALGDATRVKLPHPEIIKAAEVGSNLLVDDGKMRLTVQAKGSDYLDTIVAVSGFISDNKGVNVPDVVLPIPALTEKDRKDLAFALEMGIEYVGLSFVQRVEDVQEAKDIIKGRAWVVSKLEKPQAINNLEAIMDLTDGVMVARGDLGVECPPEAVPLIQKNIIREARKRGKPVIVATQMLESMITTPTPTRAEASDVATAVFDGADAVMLSAETASGGYPVEAVSMMRRIIVEVEKDMDWQKHVKRQSVAIGSTVEESIASAAEDISEKIQARAIVAFTLSGRAALQVSRQRPFTPIIALPSSDIISRRLAVVWGVQGLSVGQEIPVHTIEDVVNQSIEAAITQGAQKGDRIVVVGGLPFGVAGSTNTLRVATIS
ncbi:pyruvate kinase [Entomobacter blattae]|uniref:Pyruvate kinase n=1 Tax=Entomobacter blattae TaxID=2762277 RepID=A0A7H1NPF7_9PROT|nr:pyruvate kinase [Entomobacter blattae]QNT77667.1 Pyruvate kinase [Entomobacter blattae]